MPRTGKSLDRQRMVDEMGDLGVQIDTKGDVSTNQSDLSLSLVDRCSMVQISTYFNCFFSYNAATCITADIGFFY